MSNVAEPLTGDRHNDIPLAIDTENVMKIWLSDAYSNNLPKIVRHTIYQDILKMLASMVSDVYQARFQKEERKAHLDRFLYKLQSVKSYTRVIHESCFLSHGKAHHLFEKYDKMSKQAVTWRNYTR